MTQSKSEKVVVSAADTSFKLLGKSAITVRFPVLQLKLKRIKKGEFSST
jgi:hypothetical protein